MSLIASFISANALVGAPTEMYIYGSMFWLFVFAYIGAGFVAALFIPIFFPLGQ